jgi:hypothetical protein
MLLPTTLVLENKNCRWKIKTVATQVWLAAPVLRQMGVA